MSIGVSIISLPIYRYILKKNIKGQKLSNDTIFSKIKKQTFLYSHMRKNLPKSKNSRLNGVAIIKKIYKQIYICNVEHRYTPLKKFVVSILNRNYNNTSQN